MTPELKALARRAIAAGVPEVDDNTVIVIPGVSIRSIATGLVYDRTTRLPLLSDHTWPGWVQTEVHRRGYEYCINERSTRISWLITPHGLVDPEEVSSGVASGRPEALVAMLEATIGRKSETETETEKQAGAFNE